MHHSEIASDLQYVKDAKKTKQTTLTVNNHGTSQTVNKTMQLIQKLICMDKRKKGTKHTKNISYLEKRKLIENSIVTTTYANIAKPTNKPTQNQGIYPLQNV